MAQQKPHPGHTHGGLLLNSLPTTANSLKKQKNMYKVLTPNIKTPYINSYGLMGILRAHLGAMGFNHRSNFQQWQPN